MTTREEFEEFIFNLLDKNDAVEWDNDTAYRFLQAMVSWLRDADGFYRNIGEHRNTAEASWQLLADMVQAATVYE